MVRPGKTSWGKNEAPLRGTIKVSRETHTLLIWLSEQLKLPMQKIAENAINNLATEYYGRK